MGQFILDISANTFKNDKAIVRQMIDEIYKIDNKKYEIIFKTQLFESAGDNIPLEYDVFEYMYKYAMAYGYKVTSSVFDIVSLKFLLHHKIPFVKIANDRTKDYLIGHVPRNIPVYVSIGDLSDERKIDEMHNCTALYSVRKYPATFQDYDDAFGTFMCLENTAISDHTTDWELFNTYKPDIYEVHYKLEDSTGLDAGEFARTPKQLAEVL
jgi:sialic acid synthase SpsE